MFILRLLFIYLDALFIALVQKKRKKKKEGKTWTWEAQNVLPKRTHSVLVMN